MGLAFHEPTHTYRLDGQVVPSVTSLLDKLAQFAGVREEILAAARERGTAVHRACHYLDENDLDEASVAEEVVGYLRAWARFKSEVERMAAHPTLRFAGTWDRVLRIGGDEFTADIKTGEPAWPQGMQLAAYNALRGAQTAKRATVHLRRDGTYRFREWHDPDDWPAFVSLVTLHWKAARHA
jgi:hypothetical protein